MSQDNAQREAAGAFGIDTRWVRAVKRWRGNMCSHFSEQCCTLDLTNALKHVQNGRRHLNHMTVPEREGAENARTARARTAPLFSLSRICFPQSPFVHVARESHDSVKNASTRSSITPTGLLTGSRDACKKFPHRADQTRGRPYRAGQKMHETARCHTQARSRRDLLPPFVAGGLNCSTAAPPMGCGPRARQGGLNSSLPSS